MRIFKKGNEIMEKSFQERNEELIILKYINPVYDIEKQIPFYIASQCERTIDEIIACLIKENLITYAKIDQVLLRETAASLKNFLKTHEGKVSGSKEVLIKRIIQTYDPEIILDSFPKKYYVLTDNGKIILDHNRTIFNIPCTTLARYKEVFDKCLIQDYSGFKDQVYYREFNEMHLSLLDDYKLYKKEIVTITIASHVLGIRTEHNSNICKYFFNHDLPINCFYKTAKYLTGFIELKKLQEANVSELSTYETVYAIKCMNDEKMCQYCQAQSDKVYSYKEAILGVTFPPFNDCTNDFCRCYASIQLKKK